MNEFLEAVFSLESLARARGYYYDSGRGVYVSRWNGKVVPEKLVMQKMAKYSDDFVRSNLDAITQRFLAGKLDLPSWQKAMAQELKDAHRIAAIVGRGGRDAMTQADWGRVGQRLRMEYQSLNNLAKEIAEGKLSPAQIADRARRYAGGTRAAYYSGLTARKGEAKFDEERRVMGIAEHCDDCIGYAALGWQPLGSLPEPGYNSVCRSNCKCNKEYRRLSDIPEPREVGQ